jgi:tRNA A-37 threonylcarbamoyl transferase component Bud32
MGRVWRAADEMLDRQVAVKEIRIDGLDAEDTRTRRERTLREARATARIDHPNVVRVYDVVDEGERLWIVMELVAGRSLERMLAEDGPLTPRATALLGLGLVQALRQVHARGVLHRDIKPGNVLVESGDRTGHRIVLTDFGIAAMQDAEALTMVGMLVGSPDYMAPERVSGRPQGPPSDIWSLGATLSAALGGRSPFSRDTTLATLHAVLYEEPELPAAAGPLTDILTALLEKDPSIRPSLDEVESALRTVAFPTPTPTLRIGAADDIGTAEPRERRGPSLDAGEAEGDEAGAGAMRGPDLESRPGGLGRGESAREPAVGGVAPERDDGPGAARGQAAGEEEDLESRPGDPGRGESARALGPGGVESARVPTVDRADSARAPAVGGAEPVQAAGPGRDDGVGAARVPVAGDVEERERWQGDPGRMDSARALDVGGLGPARVPNEDQGNSARAAGPGRDDGAQTSEAAPVSERARAVRDPRVPEPGTEPGAAVRERAVAEPSDAVPVGHAFPGDDDEDTLSDGAQPATDVAGSAVGESIREPAVAEPSDAVPPGFAPSGGAGDRDSSVAEAPTPAEPFSTDRVASASSEAASEERSEVRSETPSGSAVGAVLRAGATTASTPLASAPTQDSLSAGAPTEHFPMPDAPTRDTPTRAASAPTRVGPGVSLVRGKQAVPDQHAHPGPTSGSGATGTPACTGSPDSADGLAANPRTNPRGANGQDPHPPPPPRHGPPSPDPRPPPPPHTPRRTPRPRHPPPRPPPNRPRRRRKHRRRRCRRGRDHPRHHLRLAR